MSRVETPLQRLPGRTLLRRLQVARGQLNPPNDPNMKLDSGFLKLVTRIRDSTDSSRTALLAALYEN